MTIAFPRLLSVEPNFESVPENPAVQEPPYADVLGVRISAVNMQIAVRLAEQWISRGKPGYVCLSGVHGVMEAQRDPQLLNIMNHATLNLPDGMPMTWIGRLQGLRQIDRVFGPDFMTAMCKLSADRGYRNYLFGGKPGIAEELRDRLRERIPDLKVVGTFTPPFRTMNSNEEGELIADVTRLKPHILWVGLSTPKQEKFMAQMASRLRVPLMVGVGAAFDYHTGKIRDSPDWIKRAGMQWLHRMLQDPKHLWRRYLRNNPAFLWHIALQLGARFRLEGMRFSQCSTWLRRQPTLTPNLRIQPSAHDMHNSCFLDPPESPSIFSELECSVSRHPARESDASSG